LATLNDIAGQKLSVCASVCLSVLALITVSHIIIAAYRNL